ncbi:hypothetical protein LIER_28432 [Lithospermum erythrorhizon]|uniref:WIYLD domain-containing protein n=1 Tax=Lithospermum erythrorhizon TaxID=34254 RepID=A0AAV3RFP3_LITER
MAPRGRTRRRNTRMDAAIDAMRPFGFNEVLVIQTVKELLKVYGGDDYWPFIEENGYRALIDILIDQNANEGEDNDDAEGRQLQNSSQQQQAPTSSVCTTSNTVADSEPIGSDVVQAVPESTMTEEMKNVAPPQSNSSQEQEALPSSVCTTSNTVANLKPIGSDVVQAVPESGRTEEMENGAPPHSCSPARDMDWDPPVERSISNWKDIRLGQNSDEKETAIAVSNRDGFAQTNNLSDQLSFAPPSSTVPVSVRPANRHAIRRPCYGWLDSNEDELEFIYLTPALPPPPVLSGHSCGESNKRRRRRSRWDLKPGDL